MWQGPSLLFSTPNPRVPSRQFSPRTHSSLGHLGDTPVAHLPSHNIGYECYRVKVILTFLRWTSRTYWDYSGSKEGSENMMVTHFMTSLGRSQGLCLWVTPMCDVSWGMVPLTAGNLPLSLWHVSETLILYLCPGAVKNYTSSSPGIFTRTEG